MEQKQTPEKIREMIFEYVLTLKESGGTIKSEQVELLKAMIEFYRILL